MSELSNLTTDKIVLSVMSDLNGRSLLGLKKYNTPLTRTDLNLDDWLRHTYEETLDKANYLKCAMEIIAKENDFALELLHRALAVIYSMKLSIMAHPDCEPNSEFQDMANTGQAVENEIRKYLNENKRVQK